MHLRHEQQINEQYTEKGIEIKQDQLDYALRAAFVTHAGVSNHWVGEIEKLVGQIVLSRAGGTLRDAVRFLAPEEQPNYTDFFKRIDNGRRSTS